MASSIFGCVLHGRTLAFYGFGRMDYDCCSVFRVAAPPPSSEPRPKLFDAHLPVHLVFVFISNTRL